MDYAGEDGLFAWVVGNCLHALLGFADFSLPCTDNAVSTWTRLVRMTFLPGVLATTCWDVHASPCLELTLL